MMQTLTGILSQETIISMHPNIQDPQLELEKKEKENESVFEQDYTFDKPIEVGEDNGEEE